MAMDKASIKVQKCSIRGCKGPGLDLSGHAQVDISDSTIEDNVGTHCCSDQSTLWTNVLLSVLGGMSVAQCNYRRYPAQLSM